MNDDRININFKVDRQTKEAFEAVLSELGLSQTDSFRVFMKSVIQEKGLPFQVKLKSPYIFEDEISGEVKSISEKHYKNFNSGITVSSMDEYDQLIDSL